MKKIFVLVAVCAFSIPMVSGCQKREGAAPPAPTATEAPKAPEHGSVSTGDCKDVPAPPEKIEIQIPDIPGGIQDPAGVR
jgi:hypothetical protein